MAKLSLCMIVKERSQALDDTLRALAPLVDEVIIATQDRQWIENNSEQEESWWKFWNIYSYEWQDDFAAARNDTFAKATGDVLFWIDADDQVIHPEKLPQLAQIIRDGQADWISLRYIYEKDDQGRIRAEQWKPRLLRKGTGVWEKSVHEVFKATQPVTVIKDTDVVIDHQAKESASRSAERNLRILQTEYAQDKDKTDPRTIYNLAMTLLTLGRFQEALPFYSQHIKQCGWPEEKYFSVHYMGECLLQLGYYDEAINAALESTKIKPEWALAYLDIARAYSYKLAWDKVIEWTLTGMNKAKPPAEEYFTNDTDYSVFPLLRLGEAYLQVHDFSRAGEIARTLSHKWPHDPLIADFAAATKQVLEDEDFVESFVTVAGRIGNHDRIAAAKLFDCLPTGLDEDARIQQARFTLVPPKSWASNSIVIYCGQGNGDDWAQPSIFQGIGGSEEAVIYLSAELTQLGYDVTVYNTCGQFRGTYQGVHYEPYYHFNSKDRFHILIGWRTPGLFTQALTAKQKLLWLHDIAYPDFFPPSVVDQVDKIIFLSQWHRTNLPDIPDSKVFISNNGINPEDFKELPPKEANTLFWGSSYDRGLLPFIQNILPLIIKEIPEVKLHVAYGWNNIQKLITDSPGIYPDLERLYQELAPILESHPNIVHHGRLSHKKLAELMGKCLVYPYASEFGETNNITSQKCQAAGCWVITTSQAGGTPERVQWGTVITGNDIYTNVELQHEFARRVVTSLRARVTPASLSNIQEDFSWRTTALTWQKGLLYEGNRVAESHQPHSKDRPRGRQGQRTSQGV